MPDLGHQLRQEAGGDIARALDAFLNAVTARLAMPDDPSLLALVVFDFGLVFLIALAPPRLVLVLVVRHFLPLLEHVGLGPVIGDPGGHKRLFEVLGVALLPVAYTKGTDFKPAFRPPVTQIADWEAW